MAELGSVAAWLELVVINGRQAWTLKSWAHLILPLISVIVLELWGLIERFFFAKRRKHAKVILLGIILLVFL